MGLNVHEISTFDWIIAAILLIFLLRGLCIGFIRQLATAIALAGSWWAAGEYAGQAALYLEGFISQPGIVFFLSFVTIFLLSALFLTLIGQLLNKMLHVNLLGWSDRLAGALLGLVRGGLTVLLLYIPLAALLPDSHALFAQSLTLPYLNHGSELIRRLVRDEGMNKVLEPKPPKEKEPEQIDPPFIPVHVPPLDKEKEYQSLPNQGQEDAGRLEESERTYNYQPSIPVQTPPPLDHAEDEPIVIPEWDSMEIEQPEQPEESAYLP